jgi:hypothetical protein
LRLGPERAFRHVRGERSFSAETLRLLLISCPANVRYLVFLSKVTELSEAVAKKEVEKNGEMSIFGQFFTSGSIQTYSVPWITVCRE